MAISALAWSESFAFVSSLAISEAAVVAGIKSESSTRVLLPISMVATAEALSSEGVM